MLSRYQWVSTGIRGFLQISVNVISVSVDVRVRVRLFDIILDTAVLRETWLIGLIVPIFKKGHTNDSANYRDTYIGIRIEMMMNLVIGLYPTMRSSIKGEH